MGTHDEWAEGRFDDGRLGGVMRFGVGFWGPYPLRQYREWAARAERLGFDAFWIGDTQLLTPDLYSTLALCVHATSRILVGSAVTNTVTRDATVTAGGFLALNEFSQGRCLLGIGVGGSAVATVGLREDPAREFRRKVAVIKGLVRGETVDVNAVAARGKIAAPVVPIYVASSSPHVLQIAGELADGVILNVGVTPELVAEAMHHVERGARRAGRDPKRLDVAVIAGASIDADRRRAIEQARAWAATTARRVGKWMAAGGQEVRTLGAAVLEQYDWAEHIRVGAAHARVVSDAMASKFVMAGTVADVVGTIQGLERCGVTHVIPLPMGSSQETTLEAFGREIIPAWPERSMASAGR
jgi:5,10-methylenetetrahydromethanopterin reductase